MRKTIYIHIGSPKTATSTIQHFLFKNNDKLKKNDFLYSQKSEAHNAHHPLCMDINLQFNRTVKDFWYENKVEMGKAWDNLLEEIKLTPQNNIIISSELFFAMNEKGHKIVNEKLSGYEVKLICFLRAQDQMFNSFYNQDVKGARQWYNSAYEFYESHQMFSLSYVERMKMLSDIYGKGNISLIPFSPKDTSPLYAFLNELGLSCLFDSNEESNDNSGLGPTGLYIKSVFNKISPNKEMNECYLNYIFKMIDEPIVSSNVRYVNKKYYEKWYSKWLDELRYLKSNYNEDLDILKIKKLDDIPYAKVDKVVLKGFLVNSLKSLFKFNGDVKISIIIRVIAFIYLDKGKSTW